MDFFFLTEYDDLEIIEMLKITSLCFFLAVFYFFSLFQNGIFQIKFRVFGNGFAYEKKIVIRNCVFI